MGQILKSTFLLMFFFFFFINVLLFHYFYVNIEKRTLTFIWGVLIGFDFFIYFILSILFYFFACLVWYFSNQNYFLKAKKDAHGFIVPSGSF